MNYSSDWKFEKLRIAAVFSKWNNFRGNLKSYELRILVVFSKWNNFKIDIYLGRLMLFRERRDDIFCLLVSRNRR